MQHLRSASAQLARSTLCNDAFRFHHCSAALGTPSVASRFTQEINKLLDFQKLIRTSTSASNVKGEVGDKYFHDDQTMSEASVRADQASWQRIAKASQTGSPGGGQSQSDTKKAEKLHELKEKLSSIKSKVSHQVDEAKKKISDVVSHGPKKPTQQPGSGGVHFWSDTH